jgi:hypothetical protein
MWIPKEIGRIATRLNSGHRVNRISVRELLKMFKAERRGLNKVHDIRAALESLGLETDPDFESAWIDGRIWIRLKGSHNAAPGTMSAEPTENAETEEDELGDNESASSDQPDGPDSTQLAPEEESQPAIVATSEGIVETALGEPRFTEKFANIVAPTLFAVRLQIGFKQTLDGVEIQKVKHTSQTRIAGEYNLRPIVILAGVVQ